MFSLRSSTPLNPPLWSLDVGAKADSGVPAVIELVHGRQTVRAIVIATWASRLLLVWKDPSSGAVRTAEYNVRQLDPTFPYSSRTVTAIRTSPLIVEFHQQPAAVFGWMPDETDPSQLESRRWP